MFRFLCFTLLTFSLASFANTDPTKPFGVGGDISSSVIKKQNDLVLKSIIHGDGIHTVIINNTVMKVGDTINGYSLVAVNDDSVVLRSKTERKKLYIFSQKIIK